LHLSRRATVLQSWHGLPTKTGELLEDPPPLERLQIRRRWLAVDFMLSSSPLVSSIYAARFGLAPEQMLELGYPIHDEIVQLRSRSAGTLFPEAPAHDRVVLYAPTFRKRARTRWFPFAGYDVHTLAEALERARAIVALRPHPNDRPEAARAAAASPRFVLADDRRMPDVAPLVARADLVVTDYSGIFLEGLLADVPCMFVPYDLAEYERGIPWSYEQYTPGPKVHGFAEFVAAMERSLRDRAAFADERRRVRDAFFLHTDGRATERVVDWLLGVLERGGGVRA
jgi:CDP-glycerol glycerophosphotransferase